MLHRRIFFSPVKNHLASIFGPFARGLAGHSKWHNIRHRKGAEDAKRAVLFSKVGKLLKAALEHGGNSPTNVQLQNVLDRAKEMKVPREVIERAMDRAMQAKAGGTVRYEGAGPAGISFIINCITDNKARTAPALRHIFTKHGCALGTTNSVAFRFRRVGQIDFTNIPEQRRNEFADVSISLGAEDIEDRGPDELAVICSPEDVAAIKTGLKDAGFESDSSDIVFIPSSKIEVAEEDQEAIQKFIEDLEELEDVEDIVHDAA